MEAIDVRDRAVDAVIERDGVRPAIGKSDEAIAASMREARADPSEEIPRGAVLERLVCLAGMIAAGPGELAGCDQRRLRRTQMWTEQSHRRHCKDVCQFHEDLGRKICEAATVAGLCDKKSRPGNIAVTPG